MTLHHRRTDQIGRTLVTAIAILALVAAAPATAWAQAATLGTFMGKVVDETGASLPGVNVTATGPALLVPAVLGVTDGEGMYRVGELPPGTYKLTFTLAGFQTMVREELRLTAGFTARIDANMKVGALEESITVSGAAPVVDVASTTRTQTFVRETLDSVPTSKTMSEILAMTPGMRTQLDVGGTNLGNLGMSGANYGMAGQGTPLIEGIDSRHRNGAGSTFFFDYQSLEEMNVQAVGVGADVGQPGTAFVAIVKSGGNDFHGTYMAAGQHRSFQSTNVDAALRQQGITDRASAFNHYYDVSADLGGRIIRDRLWFYGAYRDTSRNTNVIGYAKAPGTDGIYDTADDEPGTYKVRVPAYSTKGTFQVDRRFKVIGFAHKDVKLEPERGGSREFPYESTYNYKFDPTIYKAELQGTLNNRVVFDMVAGWRGYVAQWRFQEGTDTVGHPRRYDRTTLINTGPANYLLSYVGADQYTGSMTYFPDRFLGGHHQFKTGFSLIDDGTPQDAPDYVSGNYRLIYDAGKPAEIETFNRPVLQVEAKQVEFALYLQDTWRFGKASLNLGVRYDRYHNYSPPSEKPQGTFGGQGDFPQVEIGTWNAVNPRLGFVYDVHGNAKTVLKAHYNRFAQRLAPDRGWDFNPNYLQTTTYTWRDLDGNNDYTPGEFNPTTDFLSVSGGNANVINPDLKLETVHEASLGIERELMANMGARVMYVYKRLDNRQELVNVARPLSAWNIPITRRDPGPDGALNTADDGGKVTFYDYDAAYRGSAFVRNMLLNAPEPVPYHTLEFAVSKRPSRGWDMMFSALLTRTDDPGPQLLSSPNDAFFVSTTAPNEIHEWAWSYKAHGTYHAPFKLQFGVAYVGQRSLPAARTYVFRAADPDGGTPLRQAGTVTYRLEDYGSRRLPAQHVANLRIARPLSLGGGRELKFAVDIFNAFNANPATTQSFVSGPNFNRITEILPPRIARVGAEFRF